MKQLIFLLATSVFAATPEHNNWYYPFYQQNCIGAPLKGNVMPWCVRLPVQNLVCTSSKPVNLPSCVRVSASTQIVGQVPFAKAAGSANSLNSSANVDGSQITCPDGPLDSSCVALTAGSFPSGSLPAGVTVNGINQVVGTVPSAEIASTANNLKCASGQDTTNIGSCFRIQVSQIVGTVSVATTAHNLQCTSGQDPTTIDKCFRIPASQIVGVVSEANNSITALNAVTAVTANNLQCAQDQDITSIGPCFQIQSTQILGSIVASGLTCPSVPGFNVIPSCYTLNASQITTGNLDGSLITGTIDNPGVTFDSNVGPVACASIRSCLFKDANGSCEPPIANDPIAKYIVKCTGSKSEMYTGYCPEDDSPPDGVACFNEFAVGIPIITWSSVRTHQGCEYTCTVSGLTINTAYLTGPACTSSVAEVCI